MQNRLLCGRYDLWSRLTVACRARSKKHMRVPPGFGVLAAADHRPVRITDFLPIEPTEGPGAVGRST
eukprot:11952786-Karenia_brevis.AAC.1